jgi:hypothetical protein
VGGRRYATSKSNFLKYPNSYFFALASSGPTEPDGSFFIDRNPRWFRLILDFMIDSASLPCHSDFPEKECEEVIQEFKYYLLDLPAYFMKGQKWDQVSPLISKSGARIERNSEGWAAALVWSVSNPKSTKFRVCNVPTPGGSNFMFGLVSVNQSVRDYSGQLHGTPGTWFISDSGGCHAADGSVQPVATPTLKNNDLVELIYEKDAKRLGLTVNNVFVGWCFKEMKIVLDPHHEVQLFCVTMGKTGCAVQLA